MSLALGYSLENYLHLSLRHRHSDAYISKEESGATTLKTNDQVFEDLGAAGNLIYKGFRNKRRSFRNGWLSQQSYMKELLKLKWLLLDLDLVNTPQLHFHEMLSEVNLYV